MMNITHFFYRVFKKDDPVPDDTPCDTATLEELADKYPPEYPIGTFRILPGVRGNDLVFYVQKYMDRKGLHPSVRYHWQHIYTNGDPALSFESELAAELWIDKEINRQENHDKHINTQPRVVPPYRRLKQFTKPHKETNQ